MTIVQLNVAPHDGYGADQIETEMNLGDLLAQIEQAVEEWGADAKIITFDSTNRYGAKYGRVDNWADTFELAECEENAELLPCEECESISKEFCTCQAQS